MFLPVAQAWLINRLAGLPYPLWDTSTFSKPVNNSSE